MKEKKKYLILGTILVILIVIIVAVILVTNYQKQQKNNQTVDQSKINLNDAGKIENIEVKGDTKTNISEQLLKERENIFSVCNSYSTPVKWQYSSNN